MKLSLSIVSHRSGLLLRPLLRDLQECLPANSEVILTINTAEDESYLADCGSLPIRIIRNALEMGFGANHNQAFAASEGRYFVVMNPDIRLQDAPFEALMEVLGKGSVGLAVPLVMGADGGVEDSVRRFPTVTRLVWRLMGRKRHSDYDHGETSEPIYVDWAAGMFLMFTREAFASVGGFDSRYYMYMEDADISRRLWVAKWKVVLVPSARVIHNAQRASRRNWRHLSWHLRSALRYLFDL